MDTIDIVVFALFIIAVIAIGLIKSKNDEAKAEKNASDYFLAGRGLSWWLVGFSLIAANISTEQFVGMSGKAADWLGMAIASYEWMAAITLVVVAFVFLPKFLKAGIYTIPEFLQYRYGTVARIVMAVATLIILVGVPTASVIFSGAKVVSVFFDGTSFLGLDLGNITTACWIIGGIAALYVFAGGLKACAWADLIQGAALIIGGAIILYYCMDALAVADPVELVKTAANPNLSPEALKDAGAITRFVELNSAELPEGKLNMVRGADDPEIPWTALVLGLWIPNFFYWGLNQYIMQRSLGSKSLADGQKGVVFAAGLKLIIPFVVVIPGILCFNLFSNDLKGQADLKNAPIIQQITEGKSNSVHPMTDTFVENSPTIAAAILAHNAKITKSIPDPKLGVYENNNKQVAQANGSQVAVGSKLIGYDYDAAFPTLLKNVLNPGSGVLGFVLAAIFGAVVSSLASMLNSASTIATMDLYTKIKPSASQQQLVNFGRGCTLAFVLIAILIAPQLGSPAFGGIFTFIQEFQGFISPGILAIFIFGLLVPKTPRIAGVTGILLNVVLYGGLKFMAPEIPFLNRMAICLGAVLLVLAVLTVIKPLKEPITMPENKDIDVSSSPTAKLAGIGVVLATLVLYAIFW